jgi:Xaa-Pro aminopeptidase
VAVGADARLIVVQTGSQWLDSGAVENVLIYSDTIRSPELRHELPIGIGDAFLYAEVDGKRHVVISQMEIPRLAALGLDVELHPPEELGVDELREEGLGRDEIQCRLAVRFCERYGVNEAYVPDTFPLRLADALRAAGIGLHPRGELFSQRRRSKTDAELAGIRRAQGAAEAAMAAAAGLIRRAEPSGSVALVEGVPLTSEQIKTAIHLVFLRHGVTADELIVSHGPQSAIGHDMGAGEIVPGEPIVIDLWPRDNESACYADMTRTFVVGEPSAELTEMHAAAREALDAALAEIRPGVRGRAVFDRACDAVERAGFPTQRTKEFGKPLDEGFYHGLGHGVGLEVHENPGLGLLDEHELAVGDVVTIEPGVYRQGFGGCRLEDLVLVTEDGAENLTHFPYDLTP